MNSFDEAAAKVFAENMFKASNADKNIPIVVYIDSYGGFADGVMAMLSVIDTVPNPVVTCAVGKAMSAGAILLSHGDRRFVAPHCRVMIHEIQCGGGGHIDDVRREMQEHERLNNFIMDILAKNCGLKGYKALKKIWTTHNRDHTMSAEEAVEFGIADHVGMPLIKKVLRYEVGVRQS